MRGIGSGGEVGGIFISLLCDDGKFRSGEFAFPMREEAADPNVERGVGSKERGRKSRSEKQVARIFRHWGSDFRARLEAADFHESSAKAVWVSRELHSRRIGEKLSLAGHGGFDEVAKEVTEIANREQTKSR